MSCFVINKSIKSGPFKINKKGPIIIPITMFKCKECGETDRDIAEKYCGNTGCLYRL